MWSALTDLHVGFEGEAGAAATGMCRADQSILAVDGAEQRDSLL